MVKDVTPNAEEGFLHDLTVQYKPGEPAHYEVFTQFILLKYNEFLRKYKRPEKIVSGKKLIMERIINDAIEKKIDYIFNKQQTPPNIPQFNNNGDKNDWIKRTKKYLKIVFGMYLYTMINKKHQYPVELRQALFSGRNAILELNKGGSKSGGTTPFLQSARGNEFIQKGFTIEIPYETLLQYEKEIFYALQFYRHNEWKDTNYLHPDYSLEYLFHLNPELKQKYTKA
jgi:hypothetical protein